MRVKLRFKMPRESILKGEGEYDPNTGVVVFREHTETEIDKRLRRCSAGHNHIHEAIAIIEGKELPLELKDGRWLAHNLDFSQKLQPLRWVIPPPAPRWEIPFLKDKLEPPKKPAPFINFKGLLKKWSLIK